MLRGIINRFCRFEDDAPPLVEYPAIISATLGGALRNENTYWLGFKFDVNADAMRITRFLLWKVTGNVETHDVALFDQSGALVYSAAIDLSAVADESWGEVAVPNLLLVGGQSYFMLADFTFGTDQWHDETGTTIDAFSADLLNPVSVYRFGGTMNLSHAGTVYVPTNFIYTK